MPYLPQDYTHDTELPRAFGQDLMFQARRSVETYERFMPRIEYFVLSVSLTVGSSAPDANDDVVGAAGTTGFDDLYGEAVPVAGGADWVQPHGTEAGEGATVVATDPEIFLPACTLNGRVRRESRENELKKMGFDRVRDILVTFPTLMLDRHDITTKAGDQFIWDGDRYVVRQEDSGGYWKNTNIRLFRTLSCEHIHSGS